MAAVAGEKKVVVVVMGATGAGKSRLAIDLAAHFDGVEIISADSMQVYRGLDILTNKVPLPERNDVPHHLLGSVDPSVEFTSKDFRDLAVPIIDDILSRNGLPVIVGGTNYYIQALVSPFLVDDVVGEMDECSPIALQQDDDGADPGGVYERLKEIDPIAANRIHPNDHRKINRYLSLYSCSGVLPSNLFQGKAAEKWGQADNLKYDCCFIWIDVSTPILDRFVNERVDCMVDAGLLNELFDIYKPNADYTRGLRQAIGVREFEEFFKSYFIAKELNFQHIEDKNFRCNTVSAISCSTNEADVSFKPSFLLTLDAKDDELKVLLVEAINKLKANTRRLVRRQKRRLNRLRAYFGWDLHYIDATEALLCDGVESWHLKVVEPSVGIVRTFLCEVGSFKAGAMAHDRVDSQSPASRDLWTQYICEACGNQILRGTHEWEQHKQGRSHRKRLSHLRKKYRDFCSVNQQ